MFLLNVFNSFGVSFLLVDVDWKKKKKKACYMMLRFGTVQNGNLRVFKWPSLEIILNESEAHASVKDLSFRYTTRAG